MPLWVDEKWHVLRKVDKIKATPKEYTTPEHSEMDLLLKKYLDTGKLSEVEFLNLKTHAIEDSITGDNRLYEIVETIEQKQWKQQEVQTNQDLYLDHLSGGAKFIKDLSTVNIFSVSITAALLFTVIGWGYPKLKTLIATSTRATAILIAVGISSILWILR